MPDLHQALRVQRLRLERQAAQRIALACVMPDPCQAARLIDNALAARERGAEAGVPILSLHAPEAAPLLK